MLAAERSSLDSSSVGDPELFLSLAELQARLARLGRSPKDSGRVVLIVRKGPGGRRETPGQVMLSVAQGVPGDAWGRRTSPHPQAQIATMQSSVAALIANGQPLTLFGDNLFLDLDLSQENLPAGSRLRIGGAILEVAALPHDGCRKFLSRFGVDALKFVSGKDLRHLNLRGIYLRVVADGLVRPGDAVDVIERPSA
ncbi:MAG TPA: MOSC domain-containing protein [Anaerolineales bacterium]|nr:MOSC domain-containing protein [Anaerolineales bacterium]